VFPIGHATFGYLLYALFAWTTRHRLPYGTTLAALLVGTQFPDIVDKPLAFVGVLPSGRALGHSLFFTAGVFLLLWRLSRRYDCSHLAVAFGFGHLSHIVGDIVVMDFSRPGAVSDLSFLLYPVLPAPLYASDNVAPWVRVLRYYQSPELTPGLLLIPVTLLTFILVELRRRRRVTPK
jgi:hypothetical protein